MIKDEALRQAMDDLDRAIQNAINVIKQTKQALAQPEHHPKADIATLPEPVAEIDVKQTPSGGYVGTVCWLDLPVGYWTLYTSPPKREWQGLTDEEVFDIWLNEMLAPDKVFYQKLCRSVEAKLKQKNTWQDGDCKHCVNGCPACDARRQSNVLL